MNRSFLIVLFVLGLLFGAGILMKAKAQSRGFGAEGLEQTEPSLQIQGDKSVPRLSLA